MTTSEPEDPDERPLSRLEQLCCDEVAFGLGAGELREANVPDTARLRAELGLIAGALALREVTQRESMPVALRARIQSQAFAELDRRGPAPAPTATTTGANIVELRAAPARSSGSARLMSIALAACLALAIGVAGYRLRGSAPTTASQPVAAPATSFAPLHAVAGMMSASLTRTPAGELELIVTSDAPVPPDVSLWLHIGRGVDAPWRALDLPSGRPPSGLRATFPMPEGEVTGFAIGRTSPAVVGERPLLESNASGP